MIDPGRTLEDKLPRSTEAENAVIASCLIDSEVFPVVRAIIEADDFLSIPARETFQVIEKLWPGVDQLTVTQALNGNHAQYLSDIVSRIPTSVHAAYYARIVQVKSYQRKLIDAATKIAYMAYEGKKDSNELFLSCQQAIYDVEPAKVDDIIDAKQQAEMILTADCLRREKGITKSLPFAYVDLERLTGGMRPGNLVIIGARPAIGKSQILLEQGLYLRRMGYSVMVASAEMSIDEWSERELAILTGTPVRQQRAKGLDSDVLAEAVSDMSKLKHYWLAEPVSISRTMNKARVLKNTKGLDVLIVDYIQLLADTVSKEFGTNIRERVGYISRSLKRLARELDIVVLAAAQLNREIEAREDKRPRMGDLKESGDIEQDSDIIILLHRPSMYNQKDDPGITYLYIPKIRQIGEIGNIKLIWQAKYSKHFDVVDKQKMLVNNSSDYRVRGE